jgi:hypothetical protein
MSSFSATVFYPPKIQFLNMLSLLFDCYSHKIWELTNVDFRIFQKFFALNDNAISVKVTSAKLVKKFCTPMGALCHALRKL